MFTGGVQRYYWFKKKAVIWSEVRPFPIDIDYMVQETVETLRPSLHMSHSYDDAAEAADQLDKQFRAKLGEDLLLTTYNSSVHADSGLVE